MVEDFQAISRIVEDAQRPVPITPESGVDNHTEQQQAAQPEQLTFVSAASTSVDTSAPVEIPVEGLNEAAQPEQLTLF